VKNTPAKNLPPPGIFFSNEESSGEESSGEELSGEELSGEEFSSEECSANRIIHILVWKKILKNA
jgi:hypothetical protein